MRATSRQADPHGAVFLSPIRFGRFDHLLTRLAALALACCALVLPAFGNSSLSLAPGTSATVVVPDAAPFNALGDTRLEMRIHSWKASDAVIFSNAGFRVQLLATGELCVADTIDELREWGDIMCADVTGQADVVLRAQRDTRQRLLLFEVRSSANDWAAATYCGIKGNGTDRNKFPCSISSVSTNSWAGVGTLGNANVQVAWIKWYSALIVPGGGSLGEGSAADLADWRFEGGTPNLAATRASLGALQSPPASGAYTATPGLPPACVAGHSRTFRAGYGAELDGSASYGLDGGALAYSWSQASGPTAVAWLQRNAARPAIAGLAFGSYVFRLTVTDSAGRSSTCSVKHGAVATDDAGVVITRNPAVDTLLGKMIRFEANPWPWFDDRHKAAADKQISHLDTYFGAYWDSSSPAYASPDSELAWLYTPAPANYYDNVAGFYALYYRSGIDDYLIAARKLADRFWESPRVSRGLSCNAWAGMGNCYPARSLSVMGLVLRALDGRPDMWPGLRTIFDGYRSYYLDLADPNWGMWDTREMAYHLAVVSYCAMYDPDPLSRDLCKASISKSFSTIWTPARAADGSFPALYYKAGSWETQSRATLTHGSNEVTGVSTRWDAGMLQCSNAAGMRYPCQIWFTNNPSTRPTGNADGDAVAYTATFVSSTRLILDRPYEGFTGTHGWVLPDANAGLVGYGAQPFIQGILGVAFELAATAVAESDLTTSALARSYNAGIAGWLKDYGYWKSAKGMYYGAGFPNCRAPIAATNVFCTAENPPSGARVLNAEPLRSVMMAYQHTEDDQLKAFGDELYSAMFSKPGTGGPNPDGIYLDGLNDGTGWYMIGAPPAGAAPKYFGMLFGFSALSGWPAARMGKQTNIPPATSAPQGIPCGIGRGRRAIRLAACPGQ